MKYFYLLIFMAVACASLPAQTLPGFSSINSPYDEQAPVLSADARVLYFTVANHPLNVGGRRDPGDIWFSIRTESGWSSPIHGGSVLNDERYNAVGAVSEDGSRLMLLNHYASAAGQPVSTQGIAVSSRDGSGWSQPQNVSIPYFLNRSPVLTGSFSRDLRIFVFAAESYGSRGAEDLYVSFEENGRWTEPRHLGAALNTSFQELSPFLSDDGQTIFFATNGRSGFGSFDIYRSHRLDDTWRNWSEPENMGAAINSEARELFYREYAMGITLFTSTRNSDGYGDIRTVGDLPRAKSDTARQIITVPRDVVNSARTIRINGKIVSATTAEPIAARIVFKGKQMLSIMSGEDGQYQIDVPSTDRFRVELSAKGYVNSLEQLELQTYELAQLELNFRLQPIAVGTTVNLKSILFKLSSTELLPESYPELDVVVDFLKSNPKVEIELSGHTDSRGDARLNLKLSKQRVETVRNYLVGKGVSGKRIRGKGYGGTRPIASGVDEESRKLNRRVEFTILRD